jgi:uncharacterized protein
MGTWSRCLLSCVVVSLASAAGLNQTSQQPRSRHNISEEFDKKVVLIPMRDGVHLHTTIFVPRNAKEPLPFLIDRTPYGYTFDVYSDAFDELIEDGYIFVFQDIRGRHGSEGQFEMLRPPRHKWIPNAIDESTDAYDTIDWLLKNIPNNNGRAGVMGISYDGWLTVMAMLDPHPALKAVSEQASPADEFLGDDFHHNGAFRLSYGFEYPAMVEGATEMVFPKVENYFKFDRYDTLEWYLRLGSLSNVNRKYFNGKLPTWNNFATHVNYDDFWQKQAVTPYLDEPKVPNLNVAGWWDQDDFYGPLKIYETLEKKDKNHLNYLVVGPWNHGGWADGDGHYLGNINFDSDTGRYFRGHIQAAWFTYWLKNRGSLPLSEALVFQTGSNQWIRYGQWPPRQGITRQKLYFRAGGILSFDSPRSGEKEGFDSYVSDPQHPVPYRPRPVRPMWPGPEWPTWLVQDQRFVYLRPDVLSWETDPLQKDVVINGDIVAHLFASTSGSDSDWVVKLIDVYPEDYPKDPKMGGYQLIIADEVVRARFRNGPEKPQPLTPNQVTGYIIDLHENDHCFLKGHRIMVQVQSTWFPLIDRNPQEFVPNIFDATDADYHKATQRVYRSQAYPSHLELPIATP